MAVEEIASLEKQAMGVVLLAGLILYGCKGPQPQNLPFQAIAADVGGLSYMQEQPNLLIITAPEEVDAPGLEIQFPSALADQLRQLDYDRFFTILVLQGLKRQGG